jgi:hypothetical protein
VIDQKFTFSLSGTTCKDNPELDMVSPELANAVIEMNNYYTANRVKAELKLAAVHMWWLGFGLGVMVGLTVAVLWRML